MCIPEIREIAPEAKKQQIFAIPEKGFFLITQDGIREDIIKSVYLRTELKLGFIQITDSKHDCGQYELMTFSKYAARGNGRGTSLGADKWLQHRSPYRGVGKPTTPRKTMPRKRRDAFP